MPSDLVYVPTGAGTRRRYHVDRECVGLEAAGTVREVEREAVEPIYTPCKRCHGDARPQDRPESNLATTLKDPDFGPEDVGLSPRGEQA